MRAPPIICQDTEPHVRQLQVGVNKWDTVQSTLSAGEVQMCKDFIIKATINTCVSADRWLASFWVMIHMHWDPFAAYCDYIKINPAWSWSVPQNQDLIVQLSNINDFPTEWYNSDSRKIMTLLMLIIQNVILQLLCFFSSILCAVDG